MAQTYRQKTLAVKRALRTGKKALRSWDTIVESLEREMARLIARKTLVGPDSLTKVSSLWKAVSQGQRAVEKALLDVFAVAEY